MSEKIFNSRIIHKHDTEANWLKATNFYPKQGEIIVYDIDDTYSYERFKIGDGKTLVSELPFADDSVKEFIGEVSTDVSNVNARVDAVSTLVGDTAVSSQINSAIDNATADDFGVYVQDTEPTDAIDGDIWVDTANDPAFIVPTVPEVTEADNGKVLMVVNGTYQLVSLNLTVDADGVVSV